MRLALIAAALALAGCDAIVGARVGESSPGQAATALAPADLPAFFDCLRENNQTVVSAHRGGWQTDFPENAIVTFENAVSQAPVFLEIDVRAARDGFVVMHDDTADRTTTGHGPLADMTVAEIVRLEITGGSRTRDAHPPTLRQALDWSAGKTVLELDIKDDVRFEDIITAVREAGAMDRAIFITNSVGAAARLARLAPEAMLYVTIRSADDLDELERRGVDLSHIVAWTGDEEPNSELNIALAQRGVEARFGMFGHSARPDEAAAYAETGLQIISTDAPNAIVANLDANDGEEGYAAMQCVRAQ
jgi:glycerophosphoryl diester phosphodiesterase